MRRILKLSVALVALALVAWLGFVAWSIRSMLPGSANDLPRDASVRVPERSGSSASLEVSPPDTEPAERQGRHELPQSDSGTELIARGAGWCDDSGTVQLQWPNPEDLAAEPMATTTSPEVLEEQAMAGNGEAQWMIGFMVQQELATTPTKDRSSFPPQRFEYLRNFLILAIRNGRQSAARFLAEALIDAKRDVVEAAAWLRIADRVSASDGSLLQDFERQGIIVLSNEQRAESLRVAAELAATYQLPVSRVVSDGDTSNSAVNDCISSQSDPDLSAAAELDAYRVDWERNSFAPGIVPEAELQRRFRDLRTRLVTAAQRGDRSALPMLATLHRVSPTDEGAVAAAVWDRVGSKLDGTADGDSGEPSAADTLPGLPASVRLSPKPMFTDPRLHELRENFRRHGVRPGILAEQYILMLELE